MKIPLKTKVFAWYLRQLVILTKDNLARRNWHGSKKCKFCHHDETIKHLFFQCSFARSIWSTVQIGSTYTHHVVLRIFLATGLMMWILGLNHLLGWERLLLFGRYGCVEMTRFLIINVVLFCRSSTVAQLCSVCGRVYNVWFIETYLRRCLHGWRIR
jgi:hypothetical protein